MMKPAGVCCGLHGKEPWLSGMIIAIQKKLSLYQTNMTHRVFILYYQGMASAMPFIVGSLQSGDGADKGILLRDPAAPTYI